MKRDDGVEAGRTERKRDEGEQEREEGREMMTDE